MLLKYDMLQNTVSILPDDLGVSSTRQVSTVGEEDQSMYSAAKNRRKKQRTNPHDEISSRGNDTRSSRSDDDKFETLQRILDQSLGQRMSTYAVEKSAAYNFVSGIHDKLFELVEKVMTITNPALKEMYEKRIEDTKKHLEEAEKNYNKNYKEN